METDKDIQVLIAEDEYFAAQAIERVVRKSGYTDCGMAADGKEAVEMAGIKK